jgi:hypothetical protein
MKISVSHYTVKRMSVISRLPFEALVTRFDSLIGPPYMHRFSEQLQKSNYAEELTRIVQGPVSEAQLMEFMRFNLGDVLKKRFSTQADRSLPIVMGDPLTMSFMPIYVSDAGSYAPVTILIDERPDGVHLTYDTMESYLSSYSNEAGPRSWTRARPTSVGSSIACRGVTSLSGVTGTSS